MSKYNLSADQLMRASNIARCVNILEKTKMFLTYANYRRIDIDETNKKEVSQLMNAFDCGVESGILWLLKELGAEAIELFDKNEKEDDGRGMDRL